MARFLLRPEPCGVEKHWTRIAFAAGGAQASIVVPFEPGVDYLIRVRDDSLSSFRCDGAAARECGRWTWLKASLTTPKDLRAGYDGFDLLFSGEKSARRAIRGVIRRLRRSGAAIDSLDFAENPELLTGWRAQQPRPDLPVARSAALVAHVFYPDIWREILPVLSFAPASMDLIVTAPRENAELIAEIAQALPEASVIPVENIGRDIGPFLDLLEQGRLDSYALVCKIHAKKSSDGGRNAALGMVWRNRMLFDLLAAPGAVEAIVARFAAEPRVGMIGPRAYRYPSALCSLERAWGGNRAKVFELAGRMGVAEQAFRLDFFCGTMFWVRPEALRPLRRLELSRRFEAEGGAIDGALEHAVERLFSAAVERAGYRVEGVSGLDLGFSIDPL
jgi:hypothetical protein